MPVSGSWLFTDPDAYQASLEHMSVELLAQAPRDFSVQVTRVELRKMCAFRARESAVRVAYMAIQPKTALVAFPTRRRASLICDGVELPFGSIMLHGARERFHQRTDAATSWGYISLSARLLTAYVKRLSGRVLTIAGAGQILRPLPSDWAQLMRLHAEAGRVAETRLAHIAHPEVARALEQDLVWALVNCLTTARHHDDPSMGSDGKPLVRFEQALAAHPHRLLSIQEILAATGASETTLRAHCADALGMSPGRYQRLRHLKLATKELQRAGSATSCIAEIARRFGFESADRFVAEYHAAYGEAPFPTAHDAPAG